MMKYNNKTTHIQEKLLIIGKYNRTVDNLVGNILQLQAYMLNV